jgi:hypothetical protein
MNATRMMQNIHPKSRARRARLTLARTSPVSCALRGRRQSRAMPCRHGGSQFPELGGRRCAKTRTRHIGRVWNLSETNASRNHLLTVCSQLFRTEYMGIWICPTRRPGDQINLFHREPVLWMWDVFSIWSHVRLRPTCNNLGGNSPALPSRHLQVAGSPSWGPRQRRV